MTRVSGILGTPSEATTSSSSQIAYTPSTSSRASSAVHRDIPIESVEQVPIPASSLPHSAEYQNAAKSTSPSSGSSTSEFTFRGLSPEEPSRRETTASDIINGVGCAFSELRLATPSRFTVSSEQVTSSASTPRSANFNGNENSPLDMRSLASFLPGARQQSHTPTLASHDSGLTVPSSPRQNASSLTTPSPSRRRSGSRPLQERHEIQDEEPPQSRFHDPAFQEAFRESKELVLALKEALATSSLHDEPDTAMKKLFQEAKQLSLFKSPASRTVGLVGDSGCGKSSLVNSLLDVKALAHAMNSRGSACTCVVTEYLYHERDDFVIEVDSFSTEEIEDQITELLGAFRLYKLGELGGPEQTEQNECRDKADLALDTFVAMFRGLLSKDNHEILLGDDEEDVLNMLMDWVEELNISSRDRTETLRTAEECSNRLIELTSDHNSPQEPASWPFIRKIRVFTNAYILSKGLVLVDLPGLRDLNSARRNITERHMRNMDEIFAIASIGRAATDAGVAAVFQLARQAKLANVSIICTKSDEIRADEAVKDWKGQPKSMVQSLMDRVDQSRRNRTKLKAEIRDYDDEYDDLTEEERRDLHQLRSSLSRTEKLLVSHKFELKKFLVETRNEHVRKELNKTYAKSVLDNKLTVFFASNVDYWNSRNEPKDDALPVLRLSGILGIRKHCVALVAEAQYRAVKRYISHEIPALFDSLQLWIESGSGSLTAERKIAVCNALDKLELVLRRLTSPDSIVDRNPMKESFRANIVRYDRRERWRQSAINAASDWSGWHHSSYISFCQNYGDHYTRTIGSRNWNEELIEKAAREMQAQWEYVLLDIDEWEESAAETITSIQRLCLNTLRTEFDDDVLQMGSLTGILTHRLTLLAEDIETILDDMRKDLASLETNAFTGIRSSFIGDAMRPLYRACNSEYGSGSDRRRKNIIGQGVANPQFFPQHILRFRTDLDAIADECNAKLREKIGEHLAEIQESMKLIRDENVALESEKDPDFRARVEEVLGELKERHHVVMARL